MNRPMLHQLTIHELHEKLVKKEVSATEILQAVLRRVDEVEGRVGAYLTLTPESALSQAQAVDQALARGEPIGSLAGIPIALKDNLCTEGIRTTCSSKILENFVPPYDATVVSRLKAAGAVLLGKTNLDEFAMGSSTENSAFKTTKNPWRLDRTPGGSSGGSAAAVAADECIAALGSDTGGSIRQPAACCGVVGFKPTYGRVSRFGLIAFASSLDQIGPLCKDVLDAALLLGGIAGYDPLDTTCATHAVENFTASLREGVRGLQIGVPREYFVAGLDPEVSRAVRRAMETYEELGAKMVEVSLPHTDFAVATYYILATAEASSNLARYDGVRFGYRTDEAKSLLEMYSKTRGEGFGPEVKRRIMLGTYALSSGYYDAFYRKAQQVRTLLKRDFDLAFERVDLLLTPTAPTVAFPLGEKIEDPLQMYLSDIFTISVNLAGIPAISLPCGFSGEGLPVGLQLIGRPFGEALLLSAAHSFEEATPELRRRTPL